MSLDRVGYRAIRAQGRRGTVDRGKGRLVDQRLVEFVESVDLSPKRRRGEAARVQHPTSPDVAKAVQHLLS